MVTGQDIPYSRDFNCIDLLLCNYFPVLASCMRKPASNRSAFDESLFAHEDWGSVDPDGDDLSVFSTSTTTAAFTWRRDGSSMTSSTSDTYRRTTEIIIENTGRMRSA